MKYFTLVAITLLVSSCDKAEDGPSGDAPTKLLAQRLIDDHGEGVLAQPLIVVYDRGWIEGRGGVDQAFSANIEKLGVAEGRGFSAGSPPMKVREHYSQEGVEFGVNDGEEKSVVIDANSALNARLLLGKDAIKSLRACEAVKVSRVCRAEGEVRIVILDTEIKGAMLLGEPEVPGKVAGRWLRFAGDPRVAEDTVLEVDLGAGTHCVLSKWVLDPRDSCQM